jgi:23S rRNA pseudouridine2605 synthase
MVGHREHRRDRRADGQAATASKDAPSETIAVAAGERVAKVLARAGVASRREVERLSAAGRVVLNGQVLTTPAVIVTARDVLSVDGRPIQAAEPARVFRYHKPPGLVTTHRDPTGRPTVFEALPPGLPRLISVGRLDLNSEGLLLLTNDGGLSRALELPATALRRQYRARAHGRIDQAALDRLREGVTVEGVRYGPIEASLDKAKEGGSGSNLWITLALAEGKNREVRRVLESLGLQVNRLIRIAYGPFALGALARGAVEEVGPRVVREQLGHLIAPALLPKGDRAQYRGASAAAATSGEVDPPRQRRSAKGGDGTIKPKGQGRIPRGATDGRPGGPAATSRGRVSRTRKPGRRPAD